MIDIMRIVIYLVCFLLAGYALSGIDFEKIMKRGHTIHIQLLYLLLSMGIGYLVAQFILGLSLNYIM